MIKKITIMNKYTYNITFILLGTFSLSVLAQNNLGVYKWIDAEKKVHYTDRPAPGKIKEQNIEQKIRKAAGLSIKNTKKDPSDKNDINKEVKTKLLQADIIDDKQLDTKPTASTKEPTEKQKKASETYAKKLATYCKLQTENLAILRQDSPVAWEEQGKTILLTADQRKEKIKEIQAITKGKCSD